MDSFSCSPDSEVHSLASYVSDSEMYDFESSSEDEASDASCSPESEVQSLASYISDSEMYDFSEDEENGATNQVAQGENGHIKVPGIVYISGLPSAVASEDWVRSCFHIFANMGRIHLQPEDASGQTLEGWIEFCRRQLAKSIGEAFNNEPIYCLKNTEHEGIEYRTKYLPGVTWDQVMERLALENTEADGIEDSSCEEAGESAAPGPFDFFQ